MKVIKQRRYSVDKTDFIRQALAGYAGGAAIASEMVQNADDAQASNISFHFHTDALRVCNDSVFAEQDFVNITSIAKGDKRAEEGKIGTWGTGFLSVFHLTDAPELLSAGEHITFDPGKDELQVFETPVRDRTEFRLPWRSRKTELSLKFETETWNDERIQWLKDGMATAIYHLVIFLRNVRVIEVSEGDKRERLIARVERRLLTEQKSAHFRELWEIEYQRAGVQTRTDTWLYYRGQVPHRLDVQDVTIKDFSVALAFPLKSRDWLEQHVPGTLYNFLPTPIRTGYNFQLNGAFFPDNNRRSIIVDRSTHSKKSLWNQRVLETLGDLFVKAVLDIRDQVEEPRRFYELLPVVLPNSDFLYPVHDAFVKAAPHRPIVLTSLDEWRRPGDVFVGMPGSRLPQLAADYLPILPSGATQDFRDFLVNTLDTRRLTLEFVLAYLKPRLGAGQRLTKAHQMINNREKLQLLYSDLPSTLTFGHEEPQILDKIPLCLADDETLWPFEGEIWRASKATRHLLANTGIRFVDAEMQAQFPRLFERLVAEFKGADLVNWLAQRQWPATPFSLADAPSVIGSADRLAELLKFIYKDLSRVNIQNLARPPLVRTGDDLLYCGRDGVYQHNDADERATMQDIGLAFAHPDWVRDEVISAVYRRAGVEELRPRHVIKALKDHLPTWSALPHQVLVSRLLLFYDYFIRHAGQLALADKEELRCLPMCLTQQGRLTPAASEDVTLYLPSGDRLVDDRILVHLDRLQLDHLVHSDLLAQGKGRFFIQVLGLVALSPLELIRDVILNYYHNDRLDDVARRDLFHYISEQMRVWSDSKQRELWPKLIEARLVRCDDGEYRRGKKVYFASPTLDSVFVAEYHRLHPDYAVPVAQPDDADQNPYRHSTWFWLFDKLGVNEHPTPADLVRAVEQIVSTGPPGEEQVDAVRRIYDLLNREITGNVLYKNNATLERLACLEWLPARNDDGQWYTPCDVYQASQADFIGEQAPLLRFSETTTPLRQLLEMPTFPPVSVVADHLLTLAHSQQPVRLRVYEDIGRRWDELNYVTQQSLHQEAIVWDRERYWRPEHIFLSDYNHQFGHRRGYLKPPGGEAQAFLEKVGVKAHPDPWYDSITLLEEIANDYTGGRVVSEQDKQLLLINFDHLGQQQRLNSPFAELARLRQRAIVLDKDSHLHIPQRVVIDDRLDVLDQFDRDTVPVVVKEGLSEAGRRFLRVLGVPAVSEIVQRRAVDVQNGRHDERLSQRLQYLARAFQRVILTLREGQADYSQDNLPIKCITSVKLYACNRLMVEYELNDDKGWQILGYRKNEKALYDQQENAIFVETTRNEIPTLPLAKELNRILFPDDNRIDLIERLLELHPGQVDHFLDEHEFRRLQDGQALVPVETGSLQLADLGEADDGARPWETATPDAIPAPSQPTKTRQIELPLPEHILTSAETQMLDPGEQLIESLAESKPAPPVARETTVQDKGPSSDKMPAFMGQQWPIMIQKSNDYGKFFEKYRVTQAGDRARWKDDEKSRVTADTEWQSDELGYEHTDPTTAGKITQVRFTLTFMNRNEGFMRLHARARQMLADKPHWLSCQTDFEEWTFELYVNYNQGIIYNEDGLPSFFDAYNIPAGGIIYLKRTDKSDTVRLFWEQTERVIQNVKRYELTEDGEIKEFLTDVKVPCEVDEYVLRAETRLEDIQALIRKSAGKPGVFTLVHEAFGKADTRLSYQEIFARVQRQRPVSDFAIRAELYARPCFIAVGDSHWRFVPSRGIEPNWSNQPLERPPKRRRPTRASQKAPSQRVAPSSPELPAEPLTPYHHLLKQAQQEWETQGSLLQPNGRDLHLQLQLLAERWITAAQRLHSDLDVLARPERPIDELLIHLWQNLEQQPVDEQSRQDLLRYLWQVAQENQEELFAQVHHQLVNTLPDRRKYTFFPLLSQLADRAVEKERIQLAYDLYQLLQDQEAGNFQSQLERLERDKKIQDLIASIQTCETSDERWELWQEVWKDYCGSPLLRHAIQQEIGALRVSVEQQIDACLEQDIHHAFNVFMHFMALIQPLIDAWHAAPTVAPLVWGVARRVFNALMDEAVYQQALEVAAILPLNDCRLFPDRYLEAVQAIAKNMEDKSDGVAATAFLEYGIHVVGGDQQSTTDYVAYTIYEYTSRLYEQLGLFDRAYEHLCKAQRKADSSDQSKKKLLSRRLHDLKGKEERAKADTKVSQSWHAQAAALLDKLEFARLVFVAEFKKMLNELEE